MKPVIEIYIDKNKWIQFHFLADNTNITFKDYTKADLCNTDTEATHLGVQIWQESTMLTVEWTEKPHFSIKTYLMNHWCDLSEEVAYGLCHVIWHCMNTDPYTYKVTVNEDGVVMCNGITLLKKPLVSQ